MSDIRKEETERALRDFHQIAEDVSLPASKRFSLQLLLHQRDALLKAAKEAESQIKEWRAQACSWEQAIQENTSLEKGEQIRARFAELMREAGYEIF